MNIKPEELTENNFMLLDQLDHKELVPFIQTYIKKVTAYSVFYYLCNTWIFALAGYLFTKGFHTPTYDFGSQFTHFCYGLAIAFALLPLHEFIHVLAYKSQGAKNTSYAANIKKFYFMALADKFVANRREFIVIALAPFVFISAVLILLLFLVHDNWKLTIVGTLLAHTSMCGGDFGLLSYFAFHKDKIIVTYDDVEKGMTYFLRKL